MHCHNEKRYGYFYVAWMQHVIKGGASSAAKQLASYIVISSLRQEWRSISFSDWPVKKHWRISTEIVKLGNWCLAFQFEKMSLNRGIGGVEVTLVKWQYYLFYLPANWLY